MTQADSAVVRTHIVVEVSAEKAFSVFTERLGDFKPPEHNLLAAPITETVFEPRVGGHIYDRATDGTECHWARVLVYEPPLRVVFAGTSARRGSWRPIRRMRARSRSDSSPRLPTARASNSSTATSTGTVPGGKPSPMALVTTRVGRCT